MRYLVYSKTKTDNLPLSTTAINAKPCLDPSQVEIPQRAYYPTELDTGEYCGQRRDPRYIAVGDKAVVTRYQLEEASGVLAILTSLPYIDRSINLGPRVNQELQLWTRPTIPWSLNASCASRQEVVSELEKFQIEMDGQNVRTFKRRLVAIFVL